jgi:nucleoside-diphosphate-sugar epimerase
VREAQPDAVIHLAAAGVSEPFLGIETAVRHNINGTINLLRACFESNRTCKKLITSRTPGELTNLNVYATSKAAVWNFCQMYVRTHQWPIIGSMVFQAYGPGQTHRSLVPAAIQAALAEQDFPMTAGAQAKDWIYISDVVDGFLATLDANLPNGSSVDLGAGRPVAVADVVTEIFRLVDGAGKPLIGALPSRPGEVQVQQADRVQTKAQTGWETAVSLSQGLQQTINAYAAQNKI